MELLDTAKLIKSAETFCKQESGKYRKELFGVTDGKAIGTFIEHLFRNYLSEHYEMEAGSSANRHKSHLYKATAVKLSVQGQQAEDIRIGLQPHCLCI